MKNKFVINGDKTAILLNRKSGEVLETFIDTEDLKRAMQFPNTWCASWSNSTQSFYCYGKLSLPDGKRKTVLLHRWITNCPNDKQVDHFDNDTLNNCRKGNLRIAVHYENHQNRLGAQRNSSSKIRGVSWNKRKRKWQASIKVKNKRTFLGYFNDLQEAEKVVKDARKNLMPYSKEAKVS